MAPAPYTVIVMDTPSKGWRRCRIMRRSARPVNDPAAVGAPAWPPFGLRPRPQEKRGADAHEDHVGGPGGDQGREEVGAREREGDIVDGEVAGHDRDREADAEEPAAAWRLQREGNRHQDHHEIDEREGELGVELDEILPDLEAGRLELHDVVPELAITHRADGLLDADEIFHLLLQVQCGPDER